MSTDPLIQEIRNHIRDVNDFPKEGIVFKDITPIFQNPELCKSIVLRMAEECRKLNIDVIMGVESRGFFFGLPLSWELGVPFVPVRKKGKLPYKTVSYDYDLEYGSASIEIHNDAIEAGQRVLIHDDLLATGGTAAAAAELVKMCGAEAVGFSFLVALDFLNGKDRLKSYSDNFSILARY
jgi:adenine phosphoribosyltransferase